MNAFKKRTFTLPLLIRSTLATIVTSPILLMALVLPATSRRLREKVMLGVTVVNDCRYCTWVHTGLALSNGVDLDDLSLLLDRAVLGQATDGEATATLFAQHYADTVCSPSQEARAALVRQFSRYERAEIMAYIHFIYFSNLAGNSVDAWLARLSGRKVQEGHPLPEAIAALVAGPVLLGIWLASRRVRPQAMGSLTAAAPSPISARSNTH